MLAHPSVIRQSPGGVLQATMVGSRVPHDRQVGRAVLGEPPAPTSTTRFPLASNRFAIVSIASRLPTRLPRASLHSGQEITSSPSAC